MSLWHPTVQDVLTAHESVKEHSGVRSEGLRRSEGESIDDIREVLEAARQEDDEYRAAAVYLKKLIDRHPFRDGNKRTALTIAERFLDENGEGFRPHKVQEADELYNNIKWELPSMGIEETATWLKTGQIPDED